MDKITISISKKLSKKKMVLTVIDKTIGSIEYFFN